MLLVEVFRNKRKLVILVLKVYMCSTVMEGGPFLLKGFPYFPETNTNRGGTGDASFNV